MTMYETDSGQLAWDRMSDTLCDVCVYLRQIEDVETQTAQNSNELLKELIKKDHSDRNDDALARQLQKGVRKMEMLISQRKTLQKEDEFVLYRLAKFAPVVSKLSDQYAMEDSMYQSQWHDDVIEICNLVTTHNRK